MFHQPKIWCVIPAAGMGTRIGADVPKQYLTLADIPIITLTLEKLISCNIFSRLVVALAPSDHQFSQLAISQHPLVHSVIGGQTRAQSVLAGLESLQALAAPTDWVMVHDAARPFVLDTQVQQLLATCVARNTGAILAVPVSDTLKRCNAAGAIEATVPREALWQAQTPQCFAFAELLQAMHRCRDDGLSITDESSAVEAIGGSCAVVAGRADNIKITRPEDLPIAAFIAQQQAQRIHQETS